MHEELLSETRQRRRHSHIRPVMRGLGRAYPPLSSTAATLAQHATSHCYCTDTHRGRLRIRKHPSLSQHKQGLPAARRPPGAAPWRSRRVRPRRGAPARRRRPLPCRAPRPSAKSWARSPARRAAPASRHLAVSTPGPDQQSLGTHDSLYIQPACADSMNAGSRKQCHL